MDLVVSPSAGARSALRFGTRIGARAMLGFAAFLLVGNLTILAFSWVAGINGESGAGHPAIQNFERIDERLWRGGAPTRAGYRALADAGVRTVIDLRAEEHATRSHAYARELGLTVVHIPVRDGQIPTHAQVASFLETVRTARVPVYVHCQAGVGRTGTMVASYRVSAGMTPIDALRRNVGVGPPSLEQIAFMAGLGGESGEKFAQPSPLVTAMSRVLDAPRRIFSRLGF